MDILLDELGKIAYYGACAATGCKQPWNEANQAKWIAAAKAVQEIKYISIAEHAKAIDKARSDERARLKAEIIEAVSIEETTAGPYLIFRNLIIRSWLGTAYNNDAYDLADKLKQAIVKKTIERLI